MNITAPVFIDAIFQDRGLDEHICVCKGFLTDDGMGFWNVDALSDTFMDWLEYDDEEAWYFAVSTMDGEMNAKGTALRRRTSNAVQAHCLVLDDIGTKATPPPVEPSWKIETSAGNFQWGYCLEPTSDFKRYEALLEWCHDQGWGDAGAGGCYRIVRLPGSRNLKPGRGMFRSVITYWSVDEYWSLDGLAGELGCDDVTLVDYTNRSGRSIRRSVGVDGLADGGDMDHVLRWLVEQGAVVADDGGDWVDIICPWSDSHTSGSNTAGYSPLGRGGDSWAENRSFKCQHEHCRDRKLKDLNHWMVGKGGSSGMGYDPLPYYQSRYVYVVEGQEIIDMEQRTKGGGYWRMTKDEWGGLYSKNIPVVGHDKPVLAKNAFVSGRDTIKAACVAYVPGGEGTADRFGQLVVNTYVEPTWAEVSALPQVFLDHVAYLFPLEGESELFLNWLAHKVQNPARRSYAVVMVAENAYGTGRSTLKDFIERMLQGKVNNTSLGQLIGRGTSSEQNYNAWAAECQMLVVEEAKENLDAEDFYRGYETFKQNVDTKVTSFLCNPKYGKVRTDYKYFNVLIFSNHADALMLPDNDRRVVVLSNPSERKGFDYYEALASAAGSDVEAAKLYWFLKNRDITGFDPVYPPESEAKEKMVRMSSSVAEDIVACAEDILGGDLTTKTLLLDAVKMAARQLGFKKVLDNPGNVVARHWKTLESLRPKDKKGARYCVNGKQMEVRALGNVTQWRNVDLARDTKKIMEGLKVNC